MTLHVLLINISSKEYLLILYYFPKISSYTNPRKTNWKNILSSIQYFCIQRKLQTSCIFHKASSLWITSRELSSYAVTQGHIPTSLPFLWVNTRYCFRIRPQLFRENCQLKNNSNLSLILTCYYLGFYNWNRLNN